MRESAKRFLEILSEISEGGGSTQRLRTGILAFGSATDENREASECLAVGTVVNAWGVPTWGVKLSSRDKLVSDVLDQVEGQLEDRALVAPEDGVTVREWRAVIRFVMLVQLALEGTPRCGSREFIKAKRKGK